MYSACDPWRALAVQPCELCRETAVASVSHCPLPHCLHFIKRLYRRDGKKVEFISYLVGQFYAQFSSILSLCYADFTENKELFTLLSSTHHPPPQAVGVLAELHVRTWDSHCLTLWASTCLSSFILPSHLVPCIPASRWDFLQALLILRVSHVPYTCPSA